MKFIPNLAEYVINRRLICDQCDHKKTVASVNICKECGCVIQFKTKLKEATCPKGKW